jgi:hypothetical protein
MADETIILDIQFNSDKQFEEVRKLTDEIGKLRAANKQLSEQGEESSDQFIKNASDIRVYTAELRANQKVIDNTTKSQKQNGESLAAQRALLSNLKRELSLLTAEEIKNTEKGQALLKQTKDLNESLKASERLYGDNQRGIGDYEKSLDGLQQKLKDIKATFGSLDIDSQEFKDASNEAQNLQLKIDQALGKVDEFGEREPKNPIKRAFGDALITVGILGQGIQALSQQFTDNEDTQKALAKATQGVATALALANVIKEKGAILDTADIARKGIQTAATATLTAITRVFGVTSAQAIALATAGISVLIAGIVALVTNFDKVVSSVKNFLGLTDQNLEKQKELTKGYRAQQAALDSQIASQERLGNLTNDAFERQIKLQEALGKDTSKLRKLQNDAQNETLKNQIAAVQKQAELEKKSTDGTAKRYGELVRQVTDLTNKLNNINADYSVSVINTAKETSDKLKDDQEKRAAAQKEYLDKIAALNEKYLLTEREQLIKSFDDELKTIKGQGEKAIALRAAINKAKADAVLKFDNDLLLKQTEAQEKNALTLLALESDSLETRIQIFEEGFKKQERELKAAGIAQVDIERIKQKGINDITEKFNQEQFTATAQRLADQEKLELNAIDLSQATEEQKGKLKLQTQIKFQQLQLEATRAFLSADGLTDEELAKLKLLQDEIAKLQQQLGAPTGKVTLAQSLGIDKESLAAISEGAAFIGAQLGAIQDQINQRGQVEISNIEKANQAQIAAIENSTLSEEEKQKRIDQLNANSANKRYQIEKKLFEKNKAFSIVQTIIGGAQAVVKAFAELGPIGGAVAAAVIAGTTAAQISTINAQTPPSAPGFATGVVGLDGPGTQTSDSIPAWLSKGESVITADGTQYAEQKFPGLLNFLNSPHKYATGVVNLNPTIPNNPNEGLAQILASLPPPVVRVSDIDKGFTDARQVQVAGQL